MRARIWFIAGQGGARTDFTAGWLGLLPGFVNTRWTIDPGSGVSYGLMGNLRAIDQGHDLIEISKNFNIVPHSGGEFIYPASCHGHNLEINKFKSITLSQDKQLTSIA
jgi:hypothetical protein